MMFSDFAVMHYGLFRVCETAVPSPCSSPSPVRATPPPAAAAALPSCTCSEACTSSPLLTHLPPPQLDLQSPKLLPPLDAVRCAEASEPEFLALVSTRPRGAQALGWAPPAMCLGRKSTASLLQASQHCYPPALHPRAGHLPQAQQAGLHMGTTAGMHRCATAGSNSLCCSLQTWTGRMIIHKDITHS